jgi:hypothetical protein
MAIRMRSVDDVRALFARPFTGTAETAAAPGWQLIRHHVPGIRSVVVRRPVEDVVASMMHLDLGGSFAYDDGVLRRMISRVARDLERISAEPGVLTIDYDGLDTEAGCAAVFHHCLGLDMPHGWWLSLREQNVQTNVLDLLRYYHANRAEVDGFKRTCRAEMRSVVRAAQAA